MNFDLDFSAVPRFFRGILSDLRQKRLWPVAVILLVAIVAIPVVLANSSSPTPVAQVPVATPPPAAATTLPALSVESTPAHSRLTGKARDPFVVGSSTTSASTTASSASAGATSTATSTSSSGGSAMAGGGTGGSSSSTAGATSSTTSSSTASGSSHLPAITPKPKPAPSGLTSTQAYDVSLAITNSAGGLNTIDPLQRLSLIPSNQQPLLVELGVQKGGKRVLFAVQSGTVVSGPGTCTPGPIDCEVLALGQDQTESVSTQTAAGLSRVALFAITGLSTRSYRSVATANKARRSRSSAGEALIKESNLPALSLFQYEPSLGYVVDLRNVTVGR